MKVIDESDADPLFEFYAGGDLIKALRGEQNSRTFPDGYVAATELANAIVENLNSATQKGL